jgi:hypothetical protein
LPVSSFLQSILLGLKVYPRHPKETYGILPPECTTFIENSRYYRPGIDQAVFLEEDIYLFRLDGLLDLRCGNTVSGQRMREHTINRDHVSHSRHRAVAVCLLLLLPILVIGCRTANRTMGFRPDLWQQGTPDSDVRCGMADDLIKNHLRVGMTRQEVESLLGKPFADIPKGRGYTTGGRILVYGLGRCPGQIDMEELRVMLGPDGRVESFGRVQG